MVNGDDYPADVKREHVKAAGKVMTAVMGLSVIAPICRPKAATTETLRP